MKTFVVVLRGETPATAKPVFTSSNPLFLSVFVAAAEEMLALLMEEAGPRQDDGEAAREEVH